MLVIMVSGARALIFGVAALSVIVPSQSAPASRGLSTHDAKGPHGKLRHHLPKSRPAFRSWDPNQDTICLDWIDNFWEFLTIGENGPATKVDFQRFFNFMDNDANGKVTRPQFTGVWMPTTLMTIPDSDLVFRRWAVTISDNDSSIISSLNWNEVFNYYVDLEGPNQEMITKNRWQEKWRQDLAEMPNKGCPDPDFVLPAEF